ncbi:MAG TPA: zinc ribbon domain-containing protein [Candidatus Dormibacteraeota bacterium]|nr:zinc ribbon domain-containing protein [Candidatus Dormibacteraeota bacterium]
MAFCNSCGATLTPGTNFCSKCGSANAGVPTAPAPAARPVTAPPASTGSSSALKIILIIIGVIVLIGVLGVASVTFFVWRVAKNSHVNQKGDNVKIETPFGTMESSKDPEQVAKELGVDIYPGAEAQKGKASSATFGNIHTATAFYDSSDSVDKVCNFYKSQLPAATVTTSDENRCTIVSNAPPNMVTINVEPNDAGSRFQITTVNKKTSSNQ